jgi:hypothetical protein
MGTALCAGKQPFNMRCENRRRSIVVLPGHSGWKINQVKHVTFGSDWI